MSGDGWTAYMDRVRGEVDDWNARHPVGTCVLYWVWTRKLPAREGVTTGEAYLMDGHTPGVRVTDWGAAVHLSMVDVDERRSA